MDEDIEAVIDETDENEKEVPIEANEADVAEQRAEVPLPEDPE
jgi:hypothetical protein